MPRSAEAIAPSRALRRLVRPERAVGRAWGKSVSSSVSVAVGREATPTAKPGDSPALLKAIVSFGV